VSCGAKTAAVAVFCLIVGGYVVAGWVFKFLGRGR
jgi:hypothetical protein